MDIIGEQKISTTDLDLKTWCKRNGMPFHVVDLDDLITSGVTERYAFIYTGSEATKYNNGYKNHWLFLDSNTIFDSYGLFKSYNFNSTEFHPVINRPQRLQAFNSNVCGQYCALYYKFVLDCDYDEYGAGQQFCASYGFTYDRVENDKVILSEFARLS